MNFLKKISFVTVLFACIPQAKAMFGDWSSWAATGATVGAGVCAVGAHACWKTYKAFEVGSYLRLHRTVELQRALESDKKIAHGSSLGFNHLHQAVFRKNVGGTIALLAYGADSNLRYRDWLEGNGQTPLITAVQHRQTDLVAVLMAAGAQPEIIDNTGRDAHDYAVGDIDHTIQNLLNDPVAARTHVMQKVLNRADLELFSNTIDKIILRMCDGKQLTSAVVKYSNQKRQQDVLKKQLIKHAWLYRHFGKNSSPHKLPHEAIMLVESFLDRDQLSIQELFALLKPVIATARKRGHVQVEQRAKKFLANTYVDGSEYDEKSDE